MDPVTGITFEALAWAARNRGGLPRIDYSADDWAGLRTRLRQRLPAALPGWNAALAEEDGGGQDLATLLTDIFAAMAANLATYADHRANESFLRTATGPRSLLDLAALVDLRPGPGASAVTLQAFTAKDDAEGTLPASFKLAASVGTGAQRQELIFETAAALAVHASRNAMRLRGWNRSARRLRLRADAAAVQDLAVDLDAEYDGLRAAQPLVLSTGADRIALPLAATEVVGGTAPPFTRLRWAAGAAAADRDWPVAGLLIEGRPRQIAALAQAERADELALGSHRIEAEDASPFDPGSVLLVHSGGLRYGARVLDRSGHALTLGRGAPAALRRSQTELLQARWCGETAQAVRAGSVELPRSPRSHQPYPHTPAAGDLLLIEDAGGVEIATVAGVHGNLLMLGEPLARSLRPLRTAFDDNVRIRYHALAPADPATRRSALRPLRLQDLAAARAGGTTVLELDRACDGIAAGSSIALCDGVLFHASTVAAVDTVDKRSRVTLAGPAPGALLVARLQVYGAFEHRMRVLGHDRSEAWLEPGATEIEIDGRPEGLVPGLQLVLGDGRAAEGARIVRIEQRAGRGTGLRIALDRPTENRYALADLQVLGNVAAVSHGAGDRDEVLGNGDPHSAPQRFMLKRSPLAFVPDAGAAAGIAPALELFVGARRWQRVETLAGSRPADPHYALEIDEQQRAHVIFGDGHHGAAPPSGRDNITARYRTGIGRAGNLGRGAIVRMVAAAPFVAATHNPLPASGGADRDGPQQLRERVLRHVRTLGRAVTLQDHADLALAWAGVAAARADWVTEGRGAGARRRLVVTVASTGGQPLAPPQREALLAWLRARSADPQRLAVRGHRPWPVRLALQAGVHADFVRAAVQPALMQAFGSGTLADGSPAYLAFERRPLGSALVLSEVYRIAEGIAGVDHVLVGAFHAEAEPARVADRIVVPADAQAGGGDPADAGGGRLEIALHGGLG